ncbi:MAG: ABC transporter substrate-binding protein [Peptoniphilus sp.]|nr:ABC transporter substrate-binding protein [Peptoniphilus sp.]MDY3118929.1 ABC transporter substrate-binding protein [Peptoniphilus sp.]
MKKILHVLLLAAFILLTACGGGDQVAKNEHNNQAPANTSAEAEKKDDYYPVTIEAVDAEGNPVKETFDKEPERVVAVYQSAIENMLALGLEDKIVLAGQLDIDVKDEYKEAFKKVAYVKDAPSKEAVLAAKPDFILSWSSYFGDKTLGDVKEWQEKGVNTYILKNSGAVEVDSLENEYDDILHLGKIFHKEKEADAIVQSMKNRLAETEKLREGKDPVKAAILEIQDDNLFRNYGAKTVGGEIAEKAGAKLVMEEDRFGSEALLAKDPDVIFVVYYGEDKIKDKELERFTSMPALKGLSAIKNKRVYPVSLSEVYASGVRTADGIDTMIKGLYPES